MSINRLYHIWFEQIAQLRPGARISSQRNLVWLVIGLFKSRAVHLNRIASEIPGPAKLLSIVQRLRRFLANPTLRVREWYEPVARGLLQSMADIVGEIRLIADGTKVGLSHQLLIVAIAYRRRAIPLAWTWVRKAQGHSSARKQRALLAYVQRLLPPGIPVLLVGDCEFGSVEVLRQLDTWKWHYVLRQSGNNLVKVAGQGWRHFDRLVWYPGASLWLGPGLLVSFRVILVHVLSPKAGQWFSPKRGHRFSARLGQGFSPKLVQQVSPQLVHPFAAKLVHEGLCETPSDRA